MSRIAGPERLEHLGLVDPYGQARVARISEAALDEQDILVFEAYDATGDECLACLTGRATIRWTWIGTSWTATPEA